MMRNRLGAMSLAALLLAGGCSASPAEETPASATKTEAATQALSDEPTELNFNELPVLTVWAEKNGREALESSIESFEAQHGIKIVVKEKSTEKQRIELEGGVAEEAYPDIVVLPHKEIGLAAREGLISPIDVDPSVKETFLGTALRSMMFGGQLYGIPKNIEVPVFLYDDRQLKEAPKTFEELGEFLDKKKDGDVAPFAFNWEDYGVSSLVFNSFGSFAFGDDRGTFRSDRIGIANAGAERALGWLMEWREKGRLRDSAVDLEKTLKEETFVSGIFPLKTYLEVRNEYPSLHVSQIPSFQWEEKDYPARPYLQTDGWFITRNAKDPALAKQFLTHITTVDNSSFRSELTHEIVPIKGLFGEEGVLHKVSDEKADEEEENYRRVVLEEAEQALVYPNIGEMREIAPQMNTAIRLVSEEVLDIKTALLYAEEELRHLIEANYETKEYDSAKTN